MDDEYLSNSGLPLQLSLAYNILYAWSNVLIKEKCLALHCSIVQELARQYQKKRTIWYH